MNNFKKIDYSNDRVAELVDAGVCLVFLENEVPDKLLPKRACGFKSHPGHDILLL